MEDSATTSRDAEQADQGSPDGRFKGTSEKLAGYLHGLAKGVLVHAIEKGYDYLLDLVRTSYPQLIDAPYGGAIGDKAYLEGKGLLCKWHRERAHEAASLLLHHLEAAGSLENGLDVPDKDRLFLCTDLVFYSACRQRGVTIQLVPRNRNFDGEDVQPELDKRPREFFTLYRRTRGGWFWSPTETKDERDGIARV